MRKILPQAYKWYQSRSLYPEGAYLRGYNFEYNAEFRPISEPARLRENLFASGSSENIKELLKNFYLFNKKIFYQKMFLPASPSLRLNAWIDFSFMML